MQLLDFPLTDMLFAGGSARLRRRFAIGRVCVVADHSMISATTITALEGRGMEYVLGMRGQPTR